MFSKKWSYWLSIFIDIFFFFDEEMHIYYFSTIGSYCSALIDHLHKVHNAPWLRASMLDAWAKSTMQLR